MLGRIIKLLYSGGKYIFKSISISVDYKENIYVMREI